MRFDKELEILEDEEKSIGLSDSYASSISDLNAPSITSPERALINVPPRCKFDPTEFESSTQKQSDSHHRNDEVSVPAKSGNRLYRNLRWTILTPYRRLWAFALLANVVSWIIILIIPSWRQSHFTVTSTSTATNINLLLAVLLRQEYVVNLLFSAVCKIPRTAPLRLRRAIAKVYAYGGLHSGCALAALMWFISSTYLACWRIRSPIQAERAIAGTSIAVSVLLFAMTISSHPSLRAKYHNHFEGIHRFCGWTAIALFWTVTLLTVEVDSQVNDKPFAAVLARSIGFWCLTVITCSIVLPWLRLRPMVVRPEPLSDHAIRLHFEGGRATLGQGFRLSDRPLFENHAFAAIADPRTPNNFSVIVSRAGDWTNGVIKKPPRKLWTRGVLQYGAIRVATLFQPVLVVATGSGVAPCLSLFNGAPDLECRVLWSTKTPLATYGQSVIDNVMEKDPNARIIDSRVHGRPDLVSEAYWMYKRVGAEAVIVISNAESTRKVVYGLESRGIPVFAPIFDS